MIQMEQIFQSWMRSVFKRIFKTKTDPICVITFDDGVNTDYTKAFPKLQEKGILGTSFLISNSIGNEGRLSEEQITEMYNAGWDFQCHSQTHTHMWDLTNDEIRDEMEEVDQVFTDMGLPKPKHHAYPYGAGTNETDHVVREYRETVRRTTHDYRRHFQKKIFPLYRGVNIDIRTEERYKRVKHFLRQLKADGNIIVLYAHEITDDPNAEAGAYEDYFDGIIDYIKELGIQTKTISELHDYLQ